MSQGNIEDLKGIILELRSLHQIPVNKLVPRLTTITNNLAMIVNRLEWKQTDD